ncbi:Disease resistance protein [Senna tora]|uniref:Disease resistance protein n=1 Tax=Senna tora TaxID=362788 RepID=A0A834XDW0_9FABA|nr:Disease resistance protein [Senna tora]
MHNEMSSMISLCRFCYFFVTFYVHEFLWQFSWVLSGGYLIMQIFKAIRLEAGLLTTIYWHPWWLIFCLFLADYSVIAFADFAWRGITNEQRYLRAVLDDVTQALLSVDEIPQLEEVLSIITTFHATRRDLLTKHRLAITTICAFFIMDGNCNEPEKLGSSKPKYMPLKLQYKDEEDSGHHSVDSTIKFVSSVRKKVHAFIYNQSQHRVLSRDMKIHFERLLWKLTAVEAFLKDVGYVKEGIAMEKAWVEEIQVSVRDLEKALDSLTQRMFSLLHLLKAWPLLLEKTYLIDQVFKCFSQQKRRYDFQFFRRERQAPHLFLKGTVVINEVQSLIQATLGLENERYFRRYPQNKYKALQDFLHKMHQFLQKLKVTKGASNFRLSCAEQARNLARMADDAMRDKDEDFEWSDTTTTTPFDSLFYDLQRTTIAYRIKGRTRVVAGLEEDTDAIVSRLTQPTQTHNQFVFSIVGMQGIGKTCLANEVYHHRDILSKFPLRAWVSVPQDSNNNTNELLEKLATKITRTHHSNLPQEAENGREYWANKINNFLQEHPRYLLVLDNISTIEVWNMLKDAFPKPNDGRILLTTRDKTLAMALCAHQLDNIHLLRLRTMEESWVLFKEEACLPPETLSKEEREKVDQVLEKCWGLPHTISSLGRLQLPIESLSRKLEQIHEQDRTLRSENISRHANLSERQKELLTYFTFFPKNFKIPVRRLVALWVGGHGRHSGGGDNNDSHTTCEEEAETCLTELIEMNMIQAVKNNINGKPKVCCLPSYLWENNDHDATKCAPSQECIRYKDSHFFISFDTRAGDKPGENVRSLLCREIANEYLRKLRVLDLEHVFRPQLPDIIGNMVELRYLGLRWTYLEEIPSSIGNLKNLQTLDLKHTYIRILPRTIWKLQELRHLYLNHTHRSKFEHQSKTRSMQNLQTLWGVFLDENSPLKDTIDQLKSLRKLKLAFQLSEQDQKELAKRIQKLQHLQSVRLSSLDVMGRPQELHLEDYSGLDKLSDLYLYGRLKNVLVLKKLPLHLTHLTLSASGLPYDPMPYLEEFQDLRSLSLFSDSFREKHMLCSANKFPKLLVLKLWKLKGLMEWTIEEDAMKNLKELEIRSCPSLQVPNRIRHLKNLREVKLMHMDDEFVAKSEAGKKKGANQLNIVYMLVTIVSNLIVRNERKLTQALPSYWKDIWDLWEIRAAVLCSLVLQGVLIVFGNRRKFSTSDKQRIILWLAYNSMDTIAIFSLGIISKSLRCTDSTTSTIIPFWSPFLLLHLGGPNTISAYSLQDNDLWRRRVLELGGQIVAVVLVVLGSWRNTALNFLTIPMCLVGLIKCAERSWALRRVSRDQFRDSLLPNPDPGPNYARYMEEYKSKKEEGYDVSLGKLIEAPSQELVSTTVVQAITEVQFLSHANSFFGTFKRLFADLILSFDDIQNSQAFFRSRSSDEAFKVIEIELGFFYDLFYTKAFIVHSSRGLLLRLFSFSCIVTVLGVFGFVIKKAPYSNVDVLITYVLLIGAVAQEIYAVVELLSSDWILLKLGNHSKSMVRTVLYRAISSIPFSRRRWSNRMAQYNFIGFCLKERPAFCSDIQKTLHIYDRLEKHRYKDLSVVPNGLKSLVFREFQKKLRGVSDLIDCKKICSHKGDWVLQKEGCWEKLGWSIATEFDQSILLWHIATNLCYYSDLNNTDTAEVLHSETSMQLSNYMLYLLEMCPFMLPNGIGKTRLRDTCAEATEFFEEFGPIRGGTKEACTMLSQVCTDIPPSDVKGDGCKSVLFDACRLGKELEALENEEGWDSRRMWELICRVWIEMLSYAASQCRWSYHAEQLTGGGELLTHVWLLMAHLGITEQFQISQGHARVKLIVQ